MSYFTQHPNFGKLKINNVYLEFDGPKIFSAENETGASYFSYWVGDTSSHQKWFIIPCSKSKIIAFEKKQLDLLSLLENQEQDYYYSIQIPYSKKEEMIFDISHRNKIAEIELPKKGVFVKKITAYSSSSLEKNLIPTHELIVSKTNKKSRKNIFLEHMSMVCERFCELLDGFNKANNLTGDIQALTARYGSFAISLHASELVKFEIFLAKVSDLMIHKKDIILLLTEYDIDIKAFCNLLKSIETTSIDFELKITSQPNKIIKIHKIDASIYLLQLSRLSLEYISSIKVPQANDIDKIFMLIDLKWGHEPITAEALKVEPRLVAYYKQAARILGFLEFNGDLTSNGQKIALSSDYIVRMRITANAFEASDCGWAWMNWFDVTELNKLDPDSAVNFLRERCPSISEETSVRRGGTLTSWHHKLSPYYISLNNDLIQPPKTGPLK